MQIRLFNATKSLLEKRNKEGKLRRMIYSESQIDERLDLEYVQYELETLLSKNMLEVFSLSPGRDWRVHSLPPRQFLPRHVRASKGTITLKQSMKTRHGVMILDPSNEQESISERPFVVCFENEKDRFRFVNLLRAFQYSGVDLPEEIEKNFQMSMGMSGDFPLAIECGSTNVRVGSSIFGART